MSFDSHGRIVNRVIEGLPPATRRRVLAQCVRVHLVLGTVLAKPGVRERHALFPLDSLISLVASVSGHQPMEVALIGSEGMLGANQVLGMDEAPLMAVVQGAGGALRLGAGPLRRLLSEDPALRRAVGACLYRLLTDMSQNIACTRFHEIDARLARWLLMTHDRAHGDNFHLTHENLAAMLGVQRSAVSIAAAALKKGRLIDYVRGNISILSRAGLELVACECYLHSLPAKHATAH
ncbi:MAG TPA: Crp/Fnr family transcriptional regulator [Usitatibacteraceae bacterium]|nr:Crp/Fnr family transcriptional regulator [Usitatibacteraceae bacterium]